eukprot:1841439-Prymnesium_polylepis.1
MCGAAAGRRGGAHHLQRVRAVHARGQAVTRRVRQRIAAKEHGVVCAHAPFHAEPLARGVVSHREAARARARGPARPTPFGRRACGGREVRSRSAGMRESRSAGIRVTGGGRDSGEV